MPGANLACASVDLEHPSRRVAVGLEHPCRRSLRCLALRRLVALLVDGRFHAWMPEPMRRLTLAIAVTMLASPVCAASAAPRAAEAALQARVVHAGARTLTLRLGDRKVVRVATGPVVRQPVVSPTQDGPVAHVARAVREGMMISVRGLEPGVTVLVEGNVAAGRAVKVALPAPGEEQHVAGLLTAIASDAFAVQSADGASLRLHGPASGFSACERVAVAYHQDAGMLVADTVRHVDWARVDWARSAACRAPRELTGAIGNVSGDRLTIASAGRGNLTMALESPDVADGFRAGDAVDVAYGADGRVLDVEYVERDAIGTVSTVRSGTITITASAGDTPRTLTAEPAEDMFAGVRAGDRVDVVYHDCFGRLVADVVDDGLGR